MHDYRMQNYKGVYGNVSVQKPDVFNKIFQIC